MLTLPEELERLRAERRRGAAIVADLEILEAAAAAPDALEVAWRPPTKNRERITGYKVPCPCTPCNPPTCRAAPCMPTLFPCRCVTHGSGFWGFRGLG